MELPIIRESRELEQIFMMKNIGAACMIGKIDKSELTKWK